MFRKKKSVNEQHQQRLKQIAEFKRLNPTVISRPDGRTFEVPVNTPYTRFLLQVRLPEDFPVSAPFVAVSVTGLSHPWIESDGRVRGHPHLTNWNSHCVLGNIIRNVVSEFMAHPPRPSSMVQQQPPSNAADSSVSSSTRSPSQQPQQAQSGQDSNQPNRIALPPIPSKFEDLEALSAEKLRELSNDEHKYTEFLENLSIYDGVASLRNDVQNDVLQLARKNLGRENEVNELKAELEELRKVAKEHMVQYEEVQSRQRRVLQKFSVSSMASLLAEAAEKSDDLSESIRQEFVDEEINETEFLKRYVKCRSEYHNAMALRERMLESHGPN